MFRLKLLAVTSDRYAATSELKPSAGIVNVLPDDVAETSAVKLGLYVIRL